MTSNPGPARPMPLARLRVRRAFCGCAAVVMLVAVGASIGWAGAVGDQLRTDIDDVLRVLNEATLKEPTRLHDRRTTVLKILEATIDFREVARRALGRHWAERTAEEREEFIVLFSELVERSYLGKLDLYSGGQVVYLGEQEEGDLGLVRTRVISTGQGNESLVDFYLMRQTGDRWRVYDVVIDGASLTGNYRTQFNAVIRRASYHDLVKKMKATANEQK